MAEILKEWLTERLQRPITWETQEFGDMMKNGHVVASVLYSYNVINDEKFFLIRPSNIMINIKSNWKYLRDWLRNVEVFLSNHELNNIMDGKGSSLLRLFYQLFLHLDKRDRTNFIKREQKMVSNLVEKMENRFILEAVDEMEDASVNYLSKPLLNEKHYIEWQRKKSAEIKRSHDFIRHRYKKLLTKIEEKKIPCSYMNDRKKVKQLSSKEKNDMHKFALRHPFTFKNYTYEQLLSMEEDYSQRKKTLIDTEWANNYMSDLYNRLHKRTDSEEFQTQLRNVLSNTLWDVSVGDEEAKVDLGIVKKVMKLSQFEKQMCTQIMETKQQARNLSKNRIEAEREFAEQRDLQFHEYLDNVREQIHLEVVEIDFEKSRQDLLHEKLYAEKMKRKRQHWYEICYETMLGIVDYATKYAYWSRLLENDVPDHFIHEWKNLFFRMQPAFDILDPVVDLLKEYGIEEEHAPDEEEIVRLELDRQEELSDAEFLEYHNYFYPWTLDLLLPNYDPKNEERKFEYLGNRILGHVVYKLLEMKYPYPPPRPPADLPQFKSKALIRGLPDKAITVSMQILLNQRKIHVVRLESAINFCLGQFKREMIGCTDIELQYDKFILVQQDEEGKEFVKELKAEEDARSKSTDNSISMILGPIPPNCKQTQTPKVLPEEEMFLSPAADLGKYAYEALDFGDTLTDHLLAAMLVEYIKDKDDIKGFVIVNYPNSYREAKILEETFSGREPPDEAELLEDSDDIYLEETIAKHRKKEKDPYKEIRVSRLVNDPHKRISETPFQSFFTCYLRMKETEDILQEYVIWDLNEENSELIDRFYAILGMNYSLYYEVVEKDLLAMICKYIIGDFSLPCKPYDDLFGENVLSQLDFPSSDDKRMKSKMVKAELSTVKSKQNLKLKRSFTSKTGRLDKLEVVKPPESVTISAVEETLMEEVSNSSEITEVKTLAGEEDWHYADLSIPEIIGVALATCWEEIEKTYIHDLEQLFLSKRMQINSVVPYCRFVKDKMEQIILLPSFKQDLVSQFQKDYNNFEDDWRDLSVTKNEWHCRIKELQNKLYCICDERKLFAEEQRKLLLMENWIADELTAMANSFISCMQAELNRSFLTFQILHDFYFASLKKMPPMERLISKELSKIIKEAEEVPGSKRPVEDKVYRQLKNAFYDLHIKGIEMDYSNNPVNMILDNNVKLAMKCVKDVNEQYRSLIAREYTEIAKITTQVKKKDELDPLIQDTLTEEELFKDKALKAIEEWLMGINGEMYRLDLRLLALHYKALRDMKLVNDCYLRAFSEITNSINSNYMNEIKSVERLCKYMQMAVENGNKIPETLLLDRDMFIIDPNLLQFPPVAPPAELALGDVVNTMLEFKVSQLARLRSQFKFVAPTGLALQQAFIYLIQDFIFFGKESCEGPLFPEVFKQIDPELVSKLVFLLFGESAYVDWRDFLIYCLNVRFPTIDELLDVRRRFRCDDDMSTELIDRDDFINEELWFEKDFDPDDKFAQLRLNLIKHFLFELFETKENKMNYSAFLLAFCKSLDPVEGFAMALSMAVGKKICHFWEECEPVVCGLIRWKQYRDECLACAHKCANEYLDEVIARVVDFCTSTTIVEVPYEEEPKKGRGKDKKRAKKEIQSLGAKNRSQSKPNSESHMRIQTFICKPCEEPPTPEERFNLKEVHEEEHVSDVSEDANLAYAVPQDVIRKILKICLPWHYELIPDRKVTKYEEELLATFRKLEDYHEDGDIYVSQFVLEPCICKMLHKVKKFTALNLIEEVRKVCL